MKLPHLKLTALIDHDQGITPHGPVADSRAMRGMRWLCVVAGTLFLLAFWTTIGLDLPFPGDEIRFIESSRQFAGVPSLETLRTYEEMSGPLPFFYWGNWGWHFGYSLTSMRLATLLWGIATLWLLFETLAVLLDRPRLVAMAFAMVVLNPYWWTMSVFAYTDIFSMTGLMLAFVGMSRRNWLAVMLGVTIALLSRQYLVMALPMFGVMLLGWHTTDRRAAFKLAAALVTGCIPFILLVLLWRGLGPDNTLKQIYQQGYLTWKPDAAWLYLSLMGLYALPAFLWLRRRLLPESWEWAAVAAAGLLGMVFIVSPSPASIDVKITTVGLLDRMMHWLAIAPVTRQIIWSLGAALGGLLLARLLRHTLADLRSGFIGPSAVILTMLLGLLAVMPFSYLHWEKYFIPALPWAVAGVFLLRRHPRQATSPLSPSLPPPPSFPSQDPTAPASATPSQYDKTA